MRRTPLPSWLPPSGVGLVFLMPTPGHVVAVLDLLLRREVAHDLRVELGPHRVEPEARRARAPPMRRTPLPSWLPPSGVGLVFLMPTPGHVVAVLDLLLRREVAHDL